VRRRPPRRRRRSRPSRRRPSLDLLGWSKPSGPRNLRLRLKKRRPRRHLHRRLLLPLLPLLPLHLHLRPWRCPKHRSSSPNYHASSRRRPSSNQLRLLRLQLRLRKLRLKRLRRSRTLRLASCRQQSGSASRSLANRRSLRARWRQRSARLFRSRAWCSRQRRRRRRARRRHQHVLQLPPDDHRVRRVRRARPIRRRRGRQRRACWEDPDRFPRNQSARSRARKRDPACRGYAHRDRVRRCRRCHGPARVRLRRGGSVPQRRPSLPYRRRRRPLHERSRSPRA